MCGTAGPFSTGRGAQGNGGRGLLDRPVQEHGRAVFSGGERRILALCRAVLRDPHVLLLDEPTTGLDAGNVRALAEAAKAVKKDRLIVFVDHNLSFVAEVADRIIHLVDGRLDFDDDWQTFSSERADALAGLSGAAQVKASREPGAMTPAGGPQDGAGKGATKARMKSGKGKRKKPRGPGPGSRGTNG